MFKLADYVPYLLNRAGARIAAAFSAELAEHGISLQSWRVLAALLDATALRMGDLGRRTAIDVSTLSRIVDAMEAQGLVKRRRGPDDARSVWVEPSARGRALGKRIVPQALRYESIALDGFSAEEGARLRSLLVRVFANMDRLDASRARPRRKAG